MKIDWSKAPEGATGAADGCFYKKSGGVIYFYNKENEWVESMCQSVTVITQQEGYEEKPRQWPSESRIDIIGTNGNDGCHYDEVLHHTERSVAENVFKLSIEPKFMLEQELFEKLHDLVHQYDGRLSVVACIGALELVKQSVISGD